MAIASTSVKGKRKIDSDAVDSSIAIDRIAIAGTVIE
jgi:hypothetical protein